MSIVTWTVSVFPYLGLVPADVYLCLATVRLHFFPTLGTGCHFSLLNTGSVLIRDLSVRSVPIPRFPAI